VTVVATGIGKRNARPVLVPQTSQRTGTYDAPMGAAPSFVSGSTQSPAMGMSQSDSGGGYDQPSVWRNNRNQAAAQVAALEESGVERFDIPAFLRRQAD
jgi:cell division protein FtsZ